MKVRAGGIAGGADQTDALTGCDRIAVRHIDPAQVAVQGAHAVGVAHLDEVAIALGVIARADDFALGGGEDGRAFRRGDIHALVRARLGFDGQFAQAERRVDRIAAHRGGEGDLARDRTRLLDFSLQGRRHRRGDLGRRRQGGLARSIWRGGGGEHGHGGEGGRLAGVDQQGLAPRHRRVGQQASHSAASPASLRSGMKEAAPRQRTAFRGRTAYARGLWRLWG